MKKILIIFSLFFSQILIANDYKVLKLFKKDKFIIARSKDTRPNTKLYIYNGENHTADGKVLKCKNKSCLATVTTRSKNFKFQIIMKIRFKKLSEEKSRSGGYFGGLGGTLGFAYQGGYWKPIGKKAQYELALEYLSTSLANIKISGMGTAVGLQYSWYQFNQIELPLFLRLSATQTSLDFTSVDDFGFKDEQVLIFSAQSGQGLRYHFNNSLSVVAGLGFSYNTFASKVADPDSDNSYSVPFAGIFIIGNLYMYLRF